MTFPYQPLEKSLMLTRSAFRILTRHNWTPIILTRSALAKRDFDLMENAWFGMTLISSCRSEACEHASPYSRRVECLAVAKGAGLRTWISWEPIPPDQDPAQVGKVLAEEKSGLCGLRVAEQ